MPPFAIPFQFPAFGVGATSSVAYPQSTVDANAVRNWANYTFGRIANGAQNTIRRVSTAMSPAYVTPSVHYEQNVMGQPVKYVAVTDAISEPYRPVSPTSVRHRKLMMSEATPDTATPRAVPDSAGVAPRVVPDSARTAPRAQPDTTNQAPRVVPSPQPSQQPPQEPDKKPDKKPDEDPNKKSRFKRMVEWSEEHPWKATGIGLGIATAAYPTRKYVIGPMFNYVGPAVGNVGSWIISGETPFNIPAVANDSTDLWYRGSVGKVNNSNLTREGYPTSYKETAVEQPVEQPIQEADTMTIRWVPIEGLSLSKKQ